MIDLIIPCYKNYEGLFRTIKSIDRNIFEVYIIFDGDKEPEYYPEEIEKGYHVIWRRMNEGPGVQRQFGINISHNPYIMFIDAGDEFVSQECQQEIAETIEQNPVINMFIWPYYYNGELTSSLDNRLHGKVYKRQFLKDYDITFCPACSYLNEDIGFNRTCRIIHNVREFPIYYGKTPVIKWIKNEKSLTQKNGRESFYRDQTYSLGRVTCHTVEILKRNGIKSDEEINYIAAALYYWFIRILVECPKFTTQAWYGLKRFYDYYAKEINPELFTLGNPYIKECAKYRKRVNFNINPIRFFKETISNDRIPIKYLEEKKNEGNLSEAED